MENTSDLSVSTGNFASLLSEELDSLFTLAPRSGVLSAWYGHVPFAFWIVRALQPSTLVELGTHNGVSYLAFCDAVAKANLNTRCFAVDSWLGDEQAGFYDDTVYNDLKSFHDDRFSAFSELIRSTFDDAQRYFEDGSIDLLHIDGCHSYEAVRHDFETWEPKLSDRAVVLFHDTNVRERSFGVYKFWSELATRFPHFEFLHEHGLGVLATGKNIPRKIQMLCNLNNVEAESKIRSRFAFSGRHVAGSSDLQLLKDQLAASDTRFQNLSKERNNLVGQLNDTHALAQEIANQRDSLVGQLNDTHALAQSIADQRDSIAATLTSERDDALQRLEARVTSASQIDLERSRLTKNAHALLEMSRHKDASKSADVAANHAHLMNRLHVLSNEHRAAMDRIIQLEQSTSWKLTAPLREVGSRLPKGARRWTRRFLKASWWLVTPWSTARRLEIRRQILRLSANQSPEALPVSAPAVHERFVLDRLPALTKKYDVALEWYDGDAPVVSIVVLNWNRSEMTLLCLEHILRRTTGYRYEVIIVDNGSRPEELALLQENAGIARVLSLGVNRYFGEANNLGVEIARGRLICLLNNDVFVHDSWLAPLVENLDKYPENGATGPKFLYPDGRLQEAGAIVNPDGSVIQLGKGHNADDALFNKERQVDYVSAACVIIRHADYDRILGFDLAWDPAYYEDVDLCLKLQLLGLRTIYCPQSSVTHLESATTSDASNGLRLDNIVEINRKKFVARWGTFLRDGSSRPNLVLAEDRGAAYVSGLPKVAIYTPYNITPGGGERFFLTIAEALRDLAEVYLVTPKPFSKLRILTMGRDFGLKLDHIHLCSLEVALRDCAFDLAFTIGNEIFPSVSQMATRNIYICQFPFPIEDIEFARSARANWTDQDVILVYSEFVYSHVERQIRSLDLQSRPLEILPPPVPLLPFSPVKNKTQILHVGRFFTGGHCKRQDVLIDAVERLVAEGFAVDLHLVGSIHPEPQHRAYFGGLVTKAKGLPVHFHPNCSSEELQELYRTSQFYWHATGFGQDADAAPHLAEHFGISVIEAMSAGCIPMVFASGGPKDVVEHEITGFHYRTIDDLCQSTRALLQERDTGALERLSRAAAEAAQSYDQAHFHTRVHDLATRFLGRVSARDT
jgi:GT2 family glycosyltransferase/glycosyltransferase involved in cell wall biosynthesis